MMRSEGGIKTNTIISMVLGYDDGRYIFASAICIFVHNNKTNVIVLHIYFLLLFSIKCNNTQIIDEYKK